MSQNKNNKSQQQPKLKLSANNPQNLAQIKRKRSKLLNLLLNTSWSKRSQQTNNLIKLNKILLACDANFIDEKSGQTPLSLAITSPIINGYSPASIASGPSISAAAAGAGAPLAGSEFLSNESQLLFNPSKSSSLTGGASFSVVDKLLLKNRKSFSGGQSSQLISSSSSKFAQQQQSHSTASLFNLTASLSASNELSQLLLEQQTLTISDLCQSKAPLIERILLLFIKNGCQVDGENLDGKRPLHIASIKSNFWALKTLLNLGASTNSRDKNGLTPLYYSILCKADLKITQLLLSHNRFQLAGGNIPAQLEANNDYFNKTQQQQQPTTTLNGGGDCFPIGVIDQHGWQEVHQACKLGLDAHLEKLLYYGCDIDAKISGSGNTPLHVAAINDQLNCAKILMLRGANKSLTNNSHQTAQQVAVISQNMDLAEFIDEFNDSKVVLFKDRPGNYFDLAGSIKKKLSSSASLATVAAVGAADAPPPPPSALPNSNSTASVGAAGPRAALLVHPYPYTSTTSTTASNLMNPLSLNIQEQRLRANNQQQQAAAALLSASNGGPNEAQMSNMSNISPCLSQRSCGGTSNTTSSSGVCYDHHDSNNGSNCHLSSSNNEDSNSNSNWSSSNGHYNNNQHNHNGMQHSQSEHSNVTIIAIGNTQSSTNNNTTTPSGATTSYQRNNDNHDDDDDDDGSIRNNNNNNNGSSSIINEDDLASCSSVNGAGENNNCISRSSSSVSSSSASNGMYSLISDERPLFVGTIVEATSEYQSGDPSHLHLRRADLIEVLECSPELLMPNGQLPRLANKPMIFGRRLRDGQSGLFPSFCVHRTKRNRRQKENNRPRLSGQVEIVDASAAAANTTTTVRPPVRMLSESQSMALLDYKQRVPNNQNASNLSRDDSQLRKNYINSVENFKNFYKEFQVSLLKTDGGFGFVLRGAKIDPATILTNNNNSSTSPSSTSNCSSGGSVASNGMALIDERSMSAHNLISLQYLDKIEPNSVAHKAGLKNGDFLVAVNGFDVRLSSHEQVVHLIRQSGEQVQLTIATKRVNQQANMVYTSKTLDRIKPEPPKRDPSTTLTRNQAQRVRSMLVQPLIQQQHSAGNNSTTAGIMLTSPFDANKPLPIVPKQALISPTGSSASSTMSQQHLGRSLSTNFKHETSTNANNNNLNGSFQLQSINNNNQQNNATSRSSAQSLASYCDNSQTGSSMSTPSADQHYNHARPQQAAYNHQLEQHNQQQACSLAGFAPPTPTHSSSSTTTITTVALQPNQQQAPMEDNINLTEAAAAAAAANSEERLPALPKPSGAAAPDVLSRTPTNEQANLRGAYQPATIITTTTKRSSTTGKVASVAQKVSPSGASNNAQQAEQTQQAPDCLLLDQQAAAAFPPPPPPPPPSPPPAPPQPQNKHQSINNTDTNNISRLTQRRTSAPINQLSTGRQLVIDPRELARKRDSLAVVVGHNNSNTQQQQQQSVQAPAQFGGLAAACAAAANNRMKRQQEQQQKLNDSADECIINNKPERRQESPQEKSNQIVKDKLTSDQTVACPKQLSTAQNNTQLGFAGVAKAEPEPEPIKFPEAPQPAPEYDLSEAGDETGSVDETRRTSETRDMVKEEVESNGAQANEAAALMSQKNGSDLLDAESCPIEKKRFDCKQQQQQEENLCKSIGEKSNAYCCSHSNKHRQADMMLMSATLGRRSSAQIIQQPKQTSSSTTTNKSQTLKHRATKQQRQSILQANYGAANHDINLQQQQQQQQSLEMPPMGELDLNEPDQYERREHEQDCKQHQSLQYHHQHNHNQATQHQHQHHNNQLYHQQHLHRQNNVIEQQDNRGLLILSDQQQALKQQQQQQQQQYRQQQLIQQQLKIQRQLQQQQQQQLCNHHNHHHHHHIQAHSHSHPNQSAVELQQQQQHQHGQHQQVGIIHQDHHHLHKQANSYLTLAPNDIASNAMTTISKQNLQQHYNDHNHLLHSAHNHNHHLPHQQQEPLVLIANGGANNGNGATIQQQIYNQQQTRSVAGNNSLAQQEIIAQHHRHHNHNHGHNHHQHQHQQRQPNHEALMGHNHEHHLAHNQLQTAATMQQQQQQQSNPLFTQLKQQQQQQQLYQQYVSERYHHLLN